MRYLPMLRVTLCVVMAGAAMAQVQWRKAAVMEIRSSFAMAADTARGRIVVFGGGDNETWEWDGTTWTLRTPPTSPSRRADTAAAYDSARNRVLLFGGSDTGPLGDTWMWDGTNWTQASPASAPPARWAHACAFDSLRGRVVLFGGSGAGGVLLADTWEWDGSTWSQRSPTSSPAPRSNHAMVFDTRVGRTVLFGGFTNQSVHVGDTWEWDGTNWTQRIPVTSPSGRSGHAMTFDANRGRVVLVGGAPATGVIPGDTWEWDGTTWTLRVSGQRYLQRAGHGVAFDANRGTTVLFGGNYGGPPPDPIQADTWEWNGTSWSLRAPDTNPGGRAALGHSLAFDEVNQCVVQCCTAYSGDTWCWSQGRWSRLSPATRPASRRLHALANDSVRGRIVLFGGAAGNTWTLLNDTWEWDGSTWIQLTPVIRPPASYAHDMAWLRGTGRVVLFGGRRSNGGRVTGDTWEWDGSAWTQRSPTQSPPARDQHAMASDEGRNVVVLFGGWDENVVRNDTWEWDGITWVQRQPLVSPPARRGHAMTYDRLRQRVALQGGDPNAAPQFTDTWEWDGTGWTQRSLMPPVPARNDFGLAFDATTGRSVLFGNGTGTWEYGPTHPASYSPFGAGCAGTAGTPSLAASSLPWLGDTFTLTLDNLPGTAALVFLGRSNRSWPPFTLPFPLTSIGMTGCSLFVSGQLILPATVSGSTGSLPLAIPNTPDLFGASFFNQALVLDLPANPFGAIMSNAAEGRIGGR